MKLGPTKYLAAVVVLILASAAGAFGQDLPKPDLRILNVSDEVNNGHPVKLYEIEVVNRYAFPDELFTASPSLPPCGKNPNASRTWVNIYNKKGKRLYGFCAITANSELSSMKFMIPESVTQPKVIFIDLVDRLKGKVLRSNKVDVEN